MNPYIGLAIVSAGASFGAVMGTAAATQWARRQQVKAAREAADNLKERLAASMGFTYDRETGEVDCGHEECRVENEERRRFAEEMEASAKSGHPVYEELRLEFSDCVDAHVDFPSVEHIREMYGISEASAQELHNRLSREFNEESGE